MRRSFLPFLFVIFLSLLAGCDDGGSSETMPSVPGGDDHTFEVSLVRPSPCQRIYGDLVINVEATDNVYGINTVYVTLDGVLASVLDDAPYAVVIPASDLPSDGAHTLEVIAENNNGKTKSAETEINIDVSSPYVKNYLVVDEDADPFDLGDAPGAVFRINGVDGTVCALASIESFVNPAGIGIMADGTIIVSDRSADLDGSGLGVGALFKVLPDRLNGVSVLSASGMFRAPIGLDITANSIFVADYDADPSEIGTAPGAIFAVNPVNGNATTVATNAQLAAPVGVTVDASGDLWIVDADADPIYDANRGSLWRYTTAGTLVFIAGSDKFMSPFMVVPDGTGNLMLSDSGWASSSLYGKLFNIDPDTGTVTEYASGGVFRSPSGLIKIEGGYLVADRDSTPGVSYGIGSILLLDDSLTLSYEYTSTMFVRPMAIVESED